MSAETVTPNAEFSLAGSPKVLLGGFQASAGIDSVPSAVVLPHPDIKATEKSIFVAGSSVLEYLAKFQKLKFAPLKASDVIIRAKDGRKGELKFEGYSNVPVIRLQSDYYNISLQVQHSVGRLAMLDTSVYGNPLVSVSVTADNRPSTIESADMEAYVGKFQKEPSLANRLSFVLDQMKEMRKRIVPALKLKCPANTAIEEMVRQNNEAVAGDTSPIDLWELILSNSVDTLDLPVIEALTKDEGAAAQSNALMFSVIAAIYREPAYSFFDRIRHFSEQFQILFVPVLDRTGAFYPGYFISMSDIWDNSKAEDKVAEITGMGPTLGNMEFSPMQQVLVRGPGPLYYNTTPLSQNLDGAGEAPLIGAWPASDKVPQNGGRVQQVSGPRWLAPPAANKWLEEVFIQNRVPTLSDLRESDQAVKADSLKAETMVSEVLKIWAQNEFTNLAMGADTISLNSILDFSWELGKRYHVTVKPNTAMKETQGMEFYGFLGNVQHRYEINGDQQAAGSTMLLFTHVEMRNSQFAYKK